MLKGKIAVVTGASSGIGAALADALAVEGVHLVLAARRKEPLREVARRAEARGVSAVAAVCDVTRKDEAAALVRDTVSRFGHIDILVNNAGRGHLASIEETTDEMIEHMFAVNAFALWYTVRPALPFMKKQRSGHIINVASMAGKIGFPYNSAYVAAKHACVGFTHALRLELVDTGVYASVILPGGVLSEWASVTEGGPMVPLFSASGPIIKSIAAERGMKLPPMEGVIPPERVANDIIECLKKPVAEVYTHRGAREFVVLSAQEREQAERFQIPVVLGERAAFEQMRTGKLA